MDFELSDIQRDIKRAAREFAEGEFTKIAQESDRAEKLSDMNLLQKARDLGFVGIFIDEQYGGMGLGFLETALVMEEFWRVDPGIGSQVMCMSFGSEMLLLFGTEDQKERYLTSVCQGGKIGAVAVTEPNAGSDVLSVSTKAVRQDGGYFINGSKMFISNGDIADFLSPSVLPTPTLIQRQLVIASLSLTGIVLVSRGTRYMESLELGPTIQQKSVSVMSGYRRKTLSVRKVKDLSALCLSLTDHGRILRPRVWGSLRAPWRWLYGIQRNEWYSANHLHPVNLFR